MSDVCREWRDDIGAAAIGRLDPVRSPAFQAHLDGCRACRDELASLRSVASVLALADPAHLDETAEPSSALGPTIVSRINFETRTRTRTRRRRLAAGIGALAAAAAIVIALLVVRYDAGPESESVAFTVHPADVRAEATLVAHSWGTEVTFKAQGLSEAHRYWLWLTGDDGKRWAAGTFVGLGEKSMTVKLAAALSYEGTKRVWVTDETDAVVLDAFTS